MKMIVPLIVPLELREIAIEYLKNLSVIEPYLINIFMLKLAAANGNVELLENIFRNVSKEMWSRMIADDEYSILRIAVKGNHVNVLKNLFRLTDVNIHNKMIRAKSDSPFLTAVTEGHINVIRLLIKMTDVNTIYDIICAKDYYLFILAASTGHVEVMKTILELIPRDMWSSMIIAGDVSVRKFAALIWASGSKYADSLNMLLEIISNDNKQDLHSYYKALDQAIFYDRVENIARLSYEINNIDILNEVLNSKPNNRSSKIYKYIKNPQLLTELGGKHLELFKKNWSYENINHIKVFLKAILPILQTCKDLTKSFDIFDNYIMQKILFYLGSENNYVLSLNEQQVSTIFSTAKYNENEIESSTQINKDFDKNHICKELSFIEKLLKKRCNNSVSIHENKKQRNL